MSNLEGHTALLPCVSDWFCNTLLQDDVHVIKLPANKEGVDIDSFRNYTGAIPMGCWEAFGWRQPGCGLLPQLHRQAVDALEERGETGARLGLGQPGQPASRFAHLLPALTPPAGWAQLACSPG